MKTIETWFLWLMIYSIIGWVYESTICSIGHRKLINRGCLNGPYCPIYGTGAVLVGDRSYDVLGGHEAGLQTVGVLYGYGSREELTSAGADLLAETPEELKTILL